MSFTTVERRGDVYFDDGTGAWTVTGYELARQVLGGDGWSSNPRSNPTLVAALADAGVDPDLFPQLLLFTDPPEHTRLRGALKSSFTPAAIADLRTRIDSIADAAIGPLPTGTDFDLLAEVARPFPLAVISELLDLGSDGAELLWTETPHLVRILDFSLEPDAVADAAAAFAALSVHLLPRVIERRQRPASDLLSRMAADPSVAAHEVVVATVLLAVAGHETTANLIANATVSLLEHPDQLHRLENDPALMGRAVNELLRHDGPVQMVARTATQDHRLGEQTVRAGEQVVIAIAAANRDPSVWTDPNRLDIERDGPAPLAFGFGRHHCVGAHLARAETEALLLRLIRRQPVLTGEPLVWSSNPTIRGLEALPLRLQG